MTAFACWNIRGFNMPQKQREVRNFVRKYDLELVGIVDTRIQEHKVQTVLNSCLPGWILEHNYQYAEAGKIWVCWRTSIGMVTCIDKDEQCVTVEVTNNMSERYVVTVVYASTDVTKRRDLWNKLINLACNIRVPWMVLGDFNSILNSQERVGGAEIRPQHFADFLDCVNITGLTDMRYCGNFLTWSNKQEN